MSELNSDDVRRTISEQLRGITGWTAEEAEIAARAADELSRTLNDRETLRAVIKSRDVVCGQCGRGYGYPACGPTHATIGQALGEL